MMVAVQVIGKILVEAPQVGGRQVCRRQKFRPQLSDKWTCVSVLLFLQIAGRRYARSTGSRAARLQAAQENARRLVAACCKHMNAVAERVVATDGRRRAEARNAGGLPGGLPGGQSRCALRSSGLLHHG